MMNRLSLAVWDDHNTQTITNEPLLSEVPLLFYTCVNVILPMKKKKKDFTILHVLHRMYSCHYSTEKLGQEQTSLQVFWSCM